MKLTAKEQTVLDSMREYTGWMTPTHVGMRCGQFYNRASGWANRPLKSLVAKGLVERRPKPIAYRAVEVGDG